jgi:signal transduction histidine kinase
LFRAARNDEPQTACGGQKNTGEPPSRSFPTNVFDRIARMSNGAPDPRWPKLLSLAVHEFRTPMTVVSGYIRMLLKDRAGPLSDQQRKLLEEAEKSCARLSGLVSEVSELSALEGGTAAFNRVPLDARALLTDAVAALPPMPDRETAIELSMDGAAGEVKGDATRLQRALSSVLAALRRELVTSDRLFVRASAREHHGARVLWVAVADADAIDRLAAAAPADLTTFDEWRGGCGLSLAVARRVLAAHGGQLWSPADGSKAAAVFTLPIE